MLLGTTVGSVAGSKAGRCSSELLHRAPAAPDTASSRMSGAASVASRSTRPSCQCRLASSAIRSECGVKGPAGKVRGMPTVIRLAAGLPPSPVTTTPSSGCSWRVGMAGAGRSAAWRDRRSPRRSKPAPLWTRTSTPWSACGTAWRSMPVSRKALRRVAPRLLDQETPAGPGLVARSASSVGAGRAEPASPPSGEQGSAAATPPVPGCCHSRGQRPARRPRRHPAGLGLPAEGPPPCLQGGVLGSSVRQRAVDRCRQGCRLCWSQGRIGDGGLQRLSKGFNAEGDLDIRR